MRADPREMRDFGCAAVPGSTGELTSFDFRRVGGRRQLVSQRPRSSKGGGSPPRAHWPARRIRTSLVAPAVTSTVALALMRSWLVAVT